MSFSKDELDILTDTEFLLTKAKVLDKLREILVETREVIEREINLNWLPKDVSKSRGKISRGENYQHLPYLVLDHPAHFSRADIFAFRTMFWWGHFFSFTWHLQGGYWHRYREIIAEKWPDIPTDYFICINDTPWEYHYSQTNYESVGSFSASQLSTLTFFKLSRKIPIASYKRVPRIALETLDFCTKLIQR